MSATLREQLASYREQAMPQGAGPIQVTETRRAFYAGAVALLALLAGSNTEAAVNAVLDELYGFSEFE